MFGAKFGLDNTLKLAALAGNPQNRLRFIHVAGTNGKGSTCAMLESIYRAAGLRTGLFTSPHLVSFSERIQVNRRLIPEDEVIRLTGLMRGLLKEFPAEHHPTFFEVVTVMALVYFAEQQCDLVIWETGLGGRLDATNIVTPLASVITNIQFDHQKWLGNTLEQIAAEKAGIIKPGVPVVTAAEEPALGVILQTAAAHAAPAAVVAQADAERFSTELNGLPLAGKHQRLNAALALTTVQILQGILPLDNAAIETGLQQVQWPGRFQIVRRENQTLVLDGAHNPAGAAALQSTLKENLGGIRPAFILGILDDKDWAEMCRILAPLAGRIFLTPVASGRTTRPSALLPVCRDAAPDTPVVLCRSTTDALLQTQNEPWVVAAGSLYLVGEILDQLVPSRSGALGEQKLNEWSAPTVR